MADQDFFLSPDDSQTLGDINYMRKSVRVRRTFPKTLKNKDGFAVEKVVSATQSQDDSFNGNGASSFNSVSNSNGASSFNSFSNSNGSTSSQPDVQATTEATTEEIKPVQPAETASRQQRIQTDTNLDMFRNMARNIRRR